MTDKAEFYLEQSLPEIVDLQRKKIFNEIEIKAIIKERSRFEYALARRVTKKIDYLRYIKYEKALEKLRAQRTIRLKIKGKPTLSDWAGKRRIRLLYERGTTKFHGDLDLWRDYLDYVVSEGSPKITGQVFAAALHMHPLCEEFWIRAAVYEFEKRSSTVTARKLLQRALRFNNKSHELWIQYTRLEVCYMEKLRQHDGMQGLEEISVNDPAMEQLGQGESQLDDATDVDPQTVQKRAMEGILRGSIPSAVFKSAMDAVPGNVTLIQRFWDLFNSEVQSEIAKAYLLPIVSQYLEAAKRQHDNSVPQRHGVTKPREAIVANTVANTSTALVI